VQKGKRLVDAVTVDPGIEKLGQDKGAVLRVRHHPWAGLQHSNLIDILFRDFSSEGPGFESESINFNDPS
jgi:hypothetical protein